MSNLNLEGRFHLNSFLLSTPGGSLELTPYAVRADIFESILESTAIFECEILDKIGLFSHFNLLEQTVDLEFTTDKKVKTGTIKYNFRIINCTSKILQNDNGVVFTITGVSQEAVKSKTIKNIPVLRQKIESENMIKAMLTLLGSKKQLSMEKTKGLHAFALSKINPLEAIDQVRLSAISEKYGSSSYVFYENSRGYHFKTIEGLIAEGSKAIGDKHFVQTTTSKVDFTSSNYRNILALKVIPNAAATVSRLTGSSNKVHRFDLLTGELSTYDKKITQVNFAQNLTTKASSELAQEDGEVFLNLFDSSQETNELGEKLNVLPYFMSNFLNTICHITVAGDSTISVGDVISCSIPEHSDLTSRGTKENKLLSGNYLITKCRHLLTFNEQAEYLQAFEVVKSVDK